jgi:hypothetical protein
LQPLATSGLVTRISKYDTNPANRPQSPHCPASGATHPRERAECPLLAGTKTDMPKYLGDVRCWVNSGKHMLALSFSVFDPKQTSGPDGRCWHDRTTSDVRSSVANGGKPDMVRTAQFGQK